MTILGCHFMMFSTNLLSPSQNSARVPAASPLLILSTSCFASFLPASSASASVGMPGISGVDGRSAFTSDSCAGTIVMPPQHHSPPSLASLA